MAFFFFFFILFYKEGVLDWGMAWRSCVLGGLRGKGGLWHTCMHTLSQLTSLYMWAPPSPHWLHSTESMRSIPLPTPWSGL